MTGFFFNVLSRFGIDGLAVNVTVMLSCGTPCSSTRLIRNLGATLTPPVLPGKDPSCAIEIYYRERLHYAATKGSADAEVLLEEVRQLRRRLGDQCPYSVREVVRG